MSDVQQLFARADLVIQGNRYDEALILFDQILAIDPENILALHNACILRENKSQYMEAASLYRRIMDLSPDSIAANLRPLYERAHSNESFHVFFWAGIELMQQCRFEEAMLHLNETLCLFQSREGKPHKNSLYHAGICQLHLNHASIATELFKTLLQRVPMHVDAWFNLGNAEQMAGHLAEAIKCYEHAITLEPDFAEAYYNASFPLQDINKGKAEEYFFRALKMKPSLQLPGGEASLHAPHLKGRYWKECTMPKDFKAIPIFINNRDRLSPLQQLIKWLLNAEYTNIILLDNASTYPPLLNYYKQLQLNSQFVQIVMLNANLGYQALWRSGICRKLNIEAPFVYTDSDIVPSEDCPDDVLKVFLQILARNPFAQKVGFGLKIDDIPTHSARHSGIMTNESRYWRYRLPGQMSEQYLASIDTTFALYRHGNYYETPYSIRTGPPYVARHTDWYLDTENLDEESIYYFKHADPASSSTKKEWNL